MPLTLVLRSDIASGHSPQWVSESGIASPVVSEAVFYVRHCMTCVNVVWYFASEQSVEAVFPCTQRCSVCLLNFSVAYTVF